MPSSVLQRHNVGRIQAWVCAVLVSPQCGREWQCAVCILGNWIRAGTDLLVDKILFMCLPRKCMLIGMILDML